MVVVERSVGRHRRGKHRAPCRPNPLPFVAVAVIVGAGAGIPVVAQAAPMTHPQRVEQPRATFVIPTPAALPHLQPAKTVVPVPAPQPKSSDDVSDGWDWTELAAAAKQFEDESGYSKRGR